MSGVASPRSKVVGVLLTAILVAAVPSLWFGWNAVGDMQREVEAGRLRLARLAATQADRVVTEAFFEIELMTQAVSLEPDELDLESQATALRPIHAQASTFHAGVMLLDEDGEIVLQEPRGRVADVNLDQVLTEAAETDDRAVSRPWLDPDSGHVVAVLSVPLYAPNSERIGTMAGVLDLAEPLISDLIVPAARLGPSGHADLVDERGAVLASTNPGHLLTPGDHPDFYASTAGSRTPRVERVAHTPSINDLDQSLWHIMAYAPLQNAPWGVAMGTNAEETLKPVRRLQHRLLMLGSASVATLVLGIGLAVRYIPRRRDE